MKDDLPFFKHECSAALSPAWCSEVHAGSIVIDVMGPDQTAVQDAVAIAHQNGLNLPTFGHFAEAPQSATATGDPHLTNMHGEKFDVHDGLHRLVHVPRGAPESEALLIIDADASMMPGEISCYNVFFTSAKISGKWVGSDVLLQHDDAPMGRKQFMLGVDGKWHGWSDLARDASNLRFSGMEPIKTSISERNASSDLPGGDEIELSIGHEHPVLVQVWASHGSNELTEQNQVQYLNLEVEHLPSNTGGLLGSDIYNRPAGSKCGLLSKDTHAIDSISDLVLTDLHKHARRLKWRISANA